MSNACNTGNPHQVIEKGSGVLNQLQITGWNILAEEVSFPVAVLNEKVLEKNAQWMQTFSDIAKVKLAPHGKTTMAPELFKLQQQMGCWGISLATVPQVITAYQHGIKRIILANQLIGRHHFELISALLKEGDLEFYCFVDSIENARALGEYFSGKKITLNILLEIGVIGGRCGWRDTSKIEQLCDAIKEYEVLNISGLSFYEGVIHGKNAIHEIVCFIHNVKSLAAQLQNKGIAQSAQFIITGAGSAWYDVVAKELTNNDEDSNYTVIIRPGCYLIHDTGIYQDAQQIVMQRSELVAQLACEDTGELTSSLEIWAYVHSIPEPGLAIIGLGKRDVAFDAGLPTPSLYFRPTNGSTENSRPTKADPNWQVVKVMDQHCMMTIPNDAKLLPGDLISFSTSHPCLTMDKWRLIGLVDDNFVIKKQIATYF
ncbi:MAG: amino acid deaminase [Colwellia sp.]|nr:amino acid deaminase [Colwellia sp.]